MCLLALIRRSDAAFPLVVASNRDERRDRKAAPPGLFVGERHRMLSPRDRVGGGTWLGVSEHRVVAGLTNRSVGTEHPLASTRGDLVHLALDHVDARAAIDAVRARCAAEDFNPFQLLVADAAETLVLRGGDGVDEVESIAENVVVLTNEHRAGELELTLEGNGTAEWPDLPLDELIARCRGVLLDTGAAGGHRILKQGAEWGTVSSAILALPATDMRELLWLYAAGSPDETEYKNYGNLGKRLLR